MAGFAVVVRDALRKHLDELDANASEGEASVLLIVGRGEERTVAVFDEYGTATLAEGDPLARVGGIGDTLELVNALACDLVAASMDGGHAPADRLADSGDLGRWLPPAAVAQAQRALHAYGQDLRTSWSAFDGRSARGALQRLAEALEHPERLAALAEEWVQDLENTEDDCGVGRSGVGRA